MKLLSSEEMQELRTEIAGLSMSDERKDELIRVLDAITISFVDQAFGLSATQISLTSRANYAFKGVKDRGNLLLPDTSEPVDPASGGAINIESPKGQ